MIPDEISRLLPIVLRDVGLASTAVISALVPVVLVRRKEPSSTIAWDPRAHLPPGGRRPPLPPLREGPRAPAGEAQAGARRDRARAGGRRTRRGPGHGRRERRPAREPPRARALPRGREAHPHEGDLGQPGRRPLRRQRDLRRHRRGHRRGPPPRARAVLPDPRRRDRGLVPRAAGCRGAPRGEGPPPDGRLRVLRPRRALVAPAPRGRRQGGGLPPDAQRAPPAGEPPEPPQDRRRRRRDGVHRRVQRRRRVPRGRHPGLRPLARRPPAHRGPGGGGAAARLLPGLGLRDGGAHRSAPVLPADARGARRRHRRHRPERARHPDRGDSPPLFRRNRRRRARGARHDALFRADRVAARGDGARGHARRGSSS